MKKETKFLDAIIKTDMGSMDMADLFAEWAESKGFEVVTVSTGAATKKPADRSRKDSHSTWKVISIVYILRLLMDIADSLKAHKRTGGMGAEELTLARGYEIYSGMRREEEQQ